MRTHILVRIDTNVGIICDSNEIKKESFPRAVSTVLFNKI